MTFYTVHMDEGPRAWGWLQERFTTISAALEAAKQTGKACTIHDGKIGHVVAVANYERHYNGETL